MAGESLTWKVAGGHGGAQDYCTDRSFPGNYFKNTPILRFTLHSNSLVNSTLVGLPHVHTGMDTPDDWRFAEYNWLGSAETPDLCEGMHTKHIHLLLSQIPIKGDT